MDLRRVMKSVRAIFSALLCSVTLGLLTSHAALAQGDAEVGKTIFEENCKACHGIDKASVGPALRGVKERHSSVDWIVKWVNDPAGLVASGDAEAKKTADLTPGAMTGFPTLSKGDVESVLAYLEVAPKAEVKKAGDTTVEVTGEPVKQDNTLLTVVLIIVLVILVLMVAVLIVLAAAMSKQMSEKEGLSEEDQELVNQKFSLLKVVTHPAFIGGVALIAVWLGLHIGIHDGLYAIGVQTGYQPVQDEIHFSHKIHAGDHEIDCNYCHTGVRKTKNANIPSLNICMNCHTQVKTDSPEIQKIYAHLDYDPKTGKYGDNPTPIIWTRVHNLPDLAYFNHSQHVKVAGLECEECHGPIKEMGEEGVYQYSELTMGWCIDCHRSKNVNSKGNGYYDELAKRHDDFKGEFTVEEMGGTECSKCHY